MDAPIVLSRADAGSLTIPVEETDHNVFRLFRVVFDAVHCRNRKVYWVEHRRGQTILRQVLNLARTTKREDKLVGMVRGEPDLDVVRLAIAAANARQILTGVRWEVYGDFACTQLLAMGRFDHFDLLHAVDPEKLRHLYGSGTIPCSANPDDWDFDGFLLTHRCPQCQAVYGKDLLIFLPGWMRCARCGYAGSDDTQDASVQSCAEALLVRLTQDAEGILGVPAPEVPADIPTYFLDIHATPIFSWFTAMRFGMLPLRDCKEAEFWGTGKKMPAAVSYDRMQRCYQRSLFPLLANDVTRTAYAQHVRAYYDRHIGALHQRTSFFVHPPWTVEDAREFALRSWEESQQQFERALEALSGLGDWMFGSSFSERTREEHDGPAVLERKHRLGEALRDFSFHTQELIEDIGNRLLGGDQ
ncbi:hypothetical protein HY635_01545 [Candidatus Uhrbacteria bacterium]|nr:hypothetical protein [Candidatus Uhrbacteria bacterium]